MVRPEDLTGAIGSKWFESLAGAGKWFSILVISAAFIGVIYLIFNILNHRIKVRYFPVYGASSKELSEIKGVEDAEKLGLELGMPGAARAREIKKKGVRHLSLLLMKPRYIFKPKTLPPVSYKHRYQEGIYFLRPDKKTWIPIEKPRLSDSVNIRVPESDMEMWQQMMGEEIARRTQDEDVMKKQLYMTVAIIIGAFALAGLIIWLSMQFAGKTIDDALSQAAPIAEGLKNLAGGGP